MLFSEEEAEDKNDILCHHQKSYQFAENLIIISLNLKLFL